MTQRYGGILRPLSVQIDGGGQAGEPPIEYIFLFRFDVDDAAPLTNPYVGEVGSLNVVGGTLQSTSGGLLLINGFSTDGNPASATVDSWNRAGLAMRVDVQFPGADARGALGWTASATPSGNILYGLTDNGGTLRYRANGNQVALHIALAQAVDHTFWFVLGPNGGKLFRLVGDVPRLEWPDDLGTTQPVHAAAHARSTACRENIDTLAGTILTGDGATDYGWAEFHVENASIIGGANQAGTTQGYTDFEYLLGTATANQIAAAIDVCKVDENNKYRFYIQRNAANTQWDLKVDKYVAGVASAAQATVTNILTTDTLRICKIGNAFTVLTRTSVPVWTARGTGFTDSDYTDATDMSVTYHANTTPQKFTHWPLESERYNDALLPIGA